MRRVLIIILTTVIFVAALLAGYYLSKFSINKNYPGKLSSYYFLDEEARQWEVFTLQPIVVGYKTADKKNYALVIYNENNKLKKAAVFITGEIAEEQSHSYFANLPHVILNSTRVISTHQEHNTMSKHDVLTEEEFAAFVPNQNITRNLEEFARKSGRPLSELKVLDWGCGRGRHVLWLRKQGFQAFGVDVDSMPIKNGLALLQSKGYPGDCLSLLDSQARSPFPDGFFDYVFSGNVFEHVADIQSVCAEMGRITRKGGGGYHVFPAQRQPIEGHLFMPFVHWLPAGQLRKFIIRVCVSLGREPNWVEVRGASAATKTEFYYRYSVNNIFYRPYSVVRRAFEESGLSVTFTTLEHPKIQKHPLISPLIKNKPFRLFLNHMLLTYKLVELQVEKR